MSNTCPLDNAVIIDNKLVRNLIVGNIVDNLYVYCDPGSHENKIEMKRAKNEGQRVKKVFPLKILKKICRDISEKNICRVHKNFVSTFHGQRKKERKKFPTLNIIFQIVLP